MYIVLLRKLSIHFKSASEAWDNELSLRLHVYVPSLLFLMTWHGFVTSVAVNAVSCHLVLCANTLQCPSSWPKRIAVPSYLNPLFLNLTSSSILHLRPLHWLFSTTSLSSGNFWMLGCTSILAPHFFVALWHCQNSRVRHLSYVFNHPYSPKTKTS